MALRTNVTDVAEILTDPPEDTSDLASFVTTANRVVTKHLSGLDDYSGEDDLLEEIEKWLAAHFASIKFKITASEQAGSVQERFQYKVDLGFSVTLYGQQAMLLDFTGTLANLSEQTKQGRSGYAFFHPGQTDYYEEELS